MKKKKKAVVQQKKANAKAKASVTLLRKPITKQEKAKMDAKHARAKTYGIKQRRAREADAAEVDTYLDVSKPFLTTKELKQAPLAQANAHPGFGIRADTHPPNKASLATSGSLWSVTDLKPTEPPCGHDGMKKLFTYNNVDIYPGSGRTIRDFEKLGADLVIDCGDVVGKFSEWVRPNTYDDALNSSLADLNCNLPRVPVVKFAWTDYGVPPMGIEIDFWADLWMILFGMATRKGKAVKVVVCCVGGHGRTGTCLASMLVATGTYGTKKSAGKEAIAFVRERHCKKAIETSKQEDYVNAMAEQYVEMMKEADAQCAKEA